MNRFYVVAPLSSLSKRTRLFKLTKYLSKTCSPITITHVGWERSPGEAEEAYLENINKKILLKGGGRGGIKTRLMYFLWFIKVFLFSLKLKKGDKVWALGFESAFPLLILSKLRGYTLIFDDADRFSMIFSLPKIIKKGIAFLEKYTSRHSALHVIPNEERYDFESNKFFILRNMPSKNEVELGYKIYKEDRFNLLDDNRLTLYVNGWLGSGRGMDLALTLSNEIEDSQFRILLAGRLDCEDARKLSTKSNVRYVGEVSNSEALSLYFNSDYVLTYYNPNSEVNRFAESNKWGDAVKTNTGIIVNSEVITADSFIHYTNTIRHPYHDHDAVISELKKHLNREHCISNENSYSDDVPFFEQGLDNILERINCAKI